MDRCGVPAVFSDHWVAAGNRQVCLAQVLTEVLQRLGSFPLEEVATGISATLGVLSLLKPALQHRHRMLLRCFPPRGSAVLPPKAPWHSGLAGPGARHPIQYCWRRDAIVGWASLLHTSGDVFDMVCGQDAEPSTLRPKKVARPCP